MEAANFADLESNQMGKPALNKHQIMEEVKGKLKNQEFAKIFLDKSGLDQFYSFLKKLPDGSLPLSTVRRSVYEVLLEIPCEESHIKSSKIQKILTSLLNSSKEYTENKKLIISLKDRWSLMSAGHKIHYNDLENFEKENQQLMKKKKKRTSASVCSG